MKLAEEEEKQLYYWFSKLTKKWNKMMKFLHGQEEMKPELLKAPEVLEFIDATTTVLNDAVDEGIRMVPPTDLEVKRLQESNFVFSGYKTFHELNEVFPSLLNEDGTRKPFKQFLNDVQTVHETYNKNYLRAEYNFATSSSLSAAQWTMYKENSERYYLQYSTAGDERVRRSHRTLDGITLPMESKFWDWYYPPNGWGCRCTVIQRRKTKFKPTDENEAMNKGSQATAGKHQEMFRFNPGKQMATFPAYNPYSVKACIGCDYKRTANPKNDQCAACKVIIDIRNQKRKESEDGNK